MTNDQLDELAGPRWQPIETAPKDGSVFLVGYDDAVAKAGRLDHSQRVYEARWNAVQDTWTARNGFLDHTHATHWMPLPAAPDAVSPASQVGMSDSECTKTPPPNAGEGLERDYPAEFEAWWATYRHRNRDAAPYSVKKQIAFDAFYFAAAQALRSNSPEAG